MANTLNKSIQETAQAFNSIRTRIEEVSPNTDLECVSPLEYYKYINGSTTGGTAAGSGLMCIYTFKDFENNPVAPSGGEFESGEFNPPEGGSLTKNVNDNTYASFAYFDGLQQKTAWSNPYKLMGEKGDPGENGTGSGGDVCVRIKIQDGHGWVSYDCGTSGEDLGYAGGDTGEGNDGTGPILLYYIGTSAPDYKTDLASDLIGRSFNRYDSKYHTGDEDETGYASDGYSGDTPEAVRDINGNGRYVWALTAYIKNNTFAMGPFCDDPNGIAGGALVRLTGENGDAGADADNIEYVYYRTRDYSIVPEIHGDRNDINGNSKDYLPGNSNRSDTGTDNPQGLIKKILTVEGFSYRIKNSDNSGSDFVAPVVGSAWGENGTDGDGLQYIFCATKDANEPARPGNAIKDAKNEGMPNPNVETNNQTKGTDDPIDMYDGNHDEYNYVWVSSIKRISETSDKGGSYDDSNHWVEGLFTDPTTGQVRARNGVDGTGYSIQLSNPNAIIPCGESYEIAEVTNNNIDSTEVRVYNGAQLVDIEEITAGVYGQEVFFTCVKINNQCGKVNFIPVVGDQHFSFGTGAKKDCIVTVKFRDSNNTLISRSVNGVLVPILGYTDYELVVIPDTIKRKISVNDEISYLPYSYEALLYTRDTNSAPRYIYPSDLPEGFEIYYKFADEDEMSDPDDGYGFDNDKNGGIKFTDKLYFDNRQDNVKSELNEKFAILTVLSYEGSSLDSDICMIVSDGKDGKNGQNGADGRNGKDGVDGIDGKDGDKYQYVYLRSKNYNRYAIEMAIHSDEHAHVNSEGEILPGAVLSEGNEEYSGFCPIGSQYVYWTDDPQGADEEFNYEWMSMRIRTDEVNRDDNIHNHTGTEFSKPILGNKGGRDGEAGVAGGRPFTVDIDGDGAQISVKTDNTVYYPGKYVECEVHAYGGADKINLSDDNISNIRVNIDNDATANNLRCTSTTKDGSIILRYSPDSVIEDLDITAIITWIYNPDDGGGDYPDFRDQVYTRNITGHIKRIEGAYRYEISTNAKVVKINKSNNNISEPAHLKAFVNKIEGNTITPLTSAELSNAGFVLAYKDNDFDSDGDPRNDNGITDYYENNSVATNGVLTSGKSQFRFYLIKSNGSDALSGGIINGSLGDFEDVFVISDGQDANNAYTADLNRESVTVLVTPNLNIDQGNPIRIFNEKTEGYDKTSNTVSFNIKATIYDGNYDDDNQPITIPVYDVELATDVTEFMNCSVIYNKSSNDGSFTITISQIRAGAEIEAETIVVPLVVTGKDENNQLIYAYTNLTVFVSCSRYNGTLVPSVSSISVSDLSDTFKVSCKIFRDGVEYTDHDLNGDTDGIHLQYQTSGEPRADYDYSGDGVTVSGSDNHLDFILMHRLDRDGQITDDGADIVIQTVPIIKPGIDGKDGKDYEGVFCRTVSETAPTITYPITGGFHTRDGVKNVTGDYTTDDLIPNGGTDDAQGVGGDNGIEYKIEGAALRKKKDGLGEKFSNPVRWAVLGKDGEDGDIGEHVFLPWPEREFSENYDRPYSDEDTPDYLPSIGSIKSKLNINSSSYPASKPRDTGYDNVTWEMTEAYPGIIYMRREKNNKKGGDGSPVRIWNTLGSKGDPGTSNILITLNPENDIISCDGNKVAYNRYSFTVPKIYYGNQDIIIDCIDYVSVYDGNTTSGLSSTNGSEIINGVTYYKTANNSKVLRSSNNIVAYDLNDHKFNSDKVIEFTLSALGSEFNSGTGTTNFDDSLTYSYTAKGTLKPLVNNYEYDIVDPNILYDPDSNTYYPEAIDLTYKKSCVGGETQYIKPGQGDTIKIGYILSETVGKVFTEDDFTAPGVSIGYNRISFTTTNNTIKSIGLGLYINSNLVFVKTSYVLCNGRKGDTGDATVGQQRVLRCRGEGKSGNMYYAHENESVENPTIYYTDYVYYTIGATKYVWMCKADYTGNEPPSSMPDYGEQLTKYGDIYTENLIADAISAATISADKITAGEFNADVLSSIRISADQISSGKISSNLIEAGSITSEKIASDSIRARHLNINDRLLFSDSGTILLGDPHGKHILLDPGISSSNPYATTYTEGTVTFHGTDGGTTLTISGDELYSRNTAILNNIASGSQSNILISQINGNTVGSQSGNTTVNLYESFAYKMNGSVRVEFDVNNYISLDGSFQDNSGQNEIWVDVKIEIDGRRVFTSSVTAGLTIDGNGFVHVNGGTLVSPGSNTSTYALNVPVYSSYTGTGSNTDNRTVSAIVEGNIDGIVANTTFMNSINGDITISYNKPIMFNKIGANGLSFTKGVEQSFMVYFTHTGLNIFARNGNNIISFDHDGFKIQNGDSTVKLDSLGHWVTTEAIV